MIRKADRLPFFIDITYNNTKLVEYKSLKIDIYQFLEI
jgi:hypothetical protein